MPAIPDYMLTIDVAHPPRPPVRVEAELQDALMKVRSTKHLRALKVVHGYGSHGRGGSTKAIVRDWAYQFRRQFRAVIDGEDYGILDDATRELRDACGQLDDADLDAANPGITILWIR